MTHTTRVLRSEWTKVRTVRSTLWTLATAVVVTVGLSAVISAFTRTSYQDLPAAERATFDPTFVSFAGMSLGQLAMIAFGVLVVTGEYSTGMIRSSLGAVPQRGTFMSAKVLVASLLVLLVGMATSFATFFLGQALLGEYGTSLGEPRVLRAVLGGGLYMTLIALFAMGVAFVLRSPLLAFGILMPFFFLISNILGGVDATREFAQYLPDQAGSMIMSVVPGSMGGGDRPYGPWGGLLIMVGWVAAALLAGYATLRRRDA
ncbi:ABC transporter permease subunit [Streptomyces sp. JJ36]|uniref:ABC transporter permease subunit n=1 Tax=Streptomyces sp. JJ36 TaxID=2736645 RepID=UPI001F2C6F43|nr:ABC transporter permease subunit [Streptomyces sp. JJ36]MCF6524928.1 ABC transporter permease subunit [Streptomyces sp. JJ36]